MLGRQELPRLPNFQTPQMVLTVIAPGMTMNPKMTTASHSDSIAADIAEGINRRVATESKASPRIITATCQDFIRSPQPSNPV